MSSRIKVDKGLDIPIVGSPEQSIGPGQSVQTVALLGADYIGLKPQILVEPGQFVGQGEPLFLDKRNPAVQFTSPGTGRVAMVNRGRHRVLQSVVIELDETVASEKTFDRERSQDRGAIRDLLLQSGAWTGFKTRPYGRVPNSADEPCSLFITAVDTRPLAANPNVVVAQRQDEFSKGMQVVSQLCEGPVFLCTGSDWSGPEPYEDKIQRVEFQGPHPSGGPGTHIHYLNPVDASRTVWHIDYQDVISIGHLFETGRLLNERVVSIGGPGVAKPRLVRTRLGVSISELLVNETVASKIWQLISGSVLDGVIAEGPMAFLGRYHNQVSVVADQVESRRFGWCGGGTEQYSFSSPFAAIRRQGLLREFSTAQNGRRAAMIPGEVFERALPLDILPAPLLRALLIKDTDAAQQLGCLELAEEDLALCSFVCPAKQDYGAALRVNLEQIEKEG